MLQNISSLDKFQNYKKTTASNSLNFCAKSSHVKQITDKGLRIVSGAIGAIGLAGVAMNNSFNSCNEIEDKLQGLTKQQKDLCTDIDGKISFDAVELVKRLQKSLINTQDAEEIINRLMLSCKNNEGTWQEPKYTTFSEDAILLANKMLDFDYNANIIHCTLSNSRGSGNHEPRMLEALSKYVESYPELNKNKIGDFTLILRKEGTIDVLEKFIELKGDDKNYFTETELSYLLQRVGETSGSSYFVTKALENGIYPIIITNQLDNARRLRSNEKKAREVLLCALFNKRLFDKPTTIYSVIRFLNAPYDSKTREQVLSMLRLMIEDESFSTRQIEEITSIFNGITDNPADDNRYRIAKLTQDTIMELYFDIKIPKTLLNPRTIIDKLKNKSKERIITELKSFADRNSEVLKKTESTKQKMLEHPELYVNGEFSSVEEQKNEITNWFYDYYTSILSLFDILDKEAIDYLMRLRLDNAKEYLDAIIYDRLSDKDMQLIKNLIKSHDVNGESFKPKQKLEMLDLVEAYKDNKLSTNIISSMLEEDKVDVDKLQLNLFHKIMLNAGMSEQEIENIPKEKLTLWDTKYSQLLSKDVTEATDSSFEDIIRAANLDDFRRYIHDTSNKYGRTNEITQNKFKQANMSYEKWLNPNKENEVEFIANDENMEQLKNIVSEIAENMNVLMQTPAKSFVVKQFKDFVKGNKFVLPEEYSISKTKTKDLLQKLTNETEEGQLYQIWKRAKDNSTCGIPERETKARGTLTVLDHLKQKLSGIDKIKLDSESKNLNLKIKMWDRVPQKDLFQGNYSTCCIGIGRGNGCYMPHYLMDTAFNMIELTNLSGKIVGNALCYFVTQSNGELAFIIDNIEINDAEKPSKDIQIQLRNAITKYADNVVKEVTGKSNVPIYISSHWNDVDVNDLPKSRDMVSFVGDIDCDEIYLDLYHDGDCNEVSRKNLTRDNELLRLK